MSKEKNKNKYGTFATDKGNSKILKKMSIVLTMLFLLVGGVVIYTNHHANKPSVAAAEISNNIPGWWYQQYFGSSVCETDNCRPDSDPDQDKLTNTQEYYYHSNPLVAYTVKDTLNDGQLVALGFDPSRTGRMTFDQVASDDTIIGDSLVFNSDIKQLINESVDLTKITLPVVKDSELQLSSDKSQQAAATYLASMQQIVNKYLKNLGPKIENAVKYDDQEIISSIEQNLILADGELKKIAVPPDFIQLHKYTISFIEILPSILQEPSQEVLMDDNNPIGNIWYDRVQATFSLYQKITLEVSRLQTKYQNAK